jgi:hypothetical protein
MGFNLFCGLVFLNYILIIIFFPALGDGGKWVNEYLIKVPSFHLGSSILSALSPDGRAESAFTPMSLGQTLSASMPDW